MQKVLSFIEITVVSVKGNTYRIYFGGMSKDEGITIWKKNIIVDEKSCRGIFRCYLSCKMSHSVKPLRIVFHRANLYISDYDGIKNLALIPSDENHKGVLKKYNRMFDKTNYLIEAKIITEMAVMKIHENQNEFKWWFTTSKYLLMYHVVILVKSFFNDESEYCPQGFLEIWEILV